MEAAPKTQDAAPLDPPSRPPVFPPAAQNDPRSNRQHDTLAPASGRVTIPVLNPSILFPALASHQRHESAARHDASGYLPTFLVNDAEILLVASAHGNHKRTRI